MNCRIEKIQKAPYPPLHRILAMPVCMSDD